MEKQTVEENMTHRPVICILDNDRERCLREEKALDEAIKVKKINASGISNFGSNHLARTGVCIFPAIDVDGMYFHFKEQGVELDFDKCCNFIEMLLKKGLVKEG